MNCEVLNSGGGTAQEVESARLSLGGGVMKINSLSVPNDEPVGLVKFKEFDVGDSTPIKAFFCD